MSAASPSVACKTLLAFAAKLTSRVITHPVPSASRAQGRKLPPHWNDRRLAMFHCGDSFSLHRSTSGGFRRLKNASNMASILTSDYIRLFPIVSDYIRLCHKTVASIRQGPAEVNEVQAGPNLPRQTLRRGPGFIQIICPTDHRVWRGAASEMLRQCKVGNS